MLDKFVNRNILPNPNSDSVFSNQFTTYIINGYKIANLNKKYSIKYKNKKTKLDWVIYLFEHKENDNYKNCNLYGMDFSENSFLISETIFPDEVFDELFADFVSNLNLNLEPQNLNFFGDNKSHPSLRNITTFERLLWTNHCYKQSKSNVLSDFEKLKEFLFVKNNLFYFYTNIYSSKSENDLSNDFFWFLVENYCFSAIRNHFIYAINTSMFFTNKSMAWMSYFSTDVVYTNQHIISMPFSLIEQKQILLEQLEYYHSEFNSALNKYHLKFLEKIIYLYKIGKIPSVRPSLFIKCHSIYRTDVTDHFENSEIINKYPFFIKFINVNSKELFYYVKNKKNKKIKKSKSSF